MITQYQAGSFLRGEIPALVSRIIPSRISLDVYASMNYFTDYTKLAVENHDLKLARKCFTLAEKLYTQGDRVVRMLVENVFIYSFSSLLAKEKTERIMLKSIIPDNLYSIYIRQVTEPGS